jgi:DNA primase
LARFAEHFIQQVAQATDIVDLVSQRVALKKAGKDFVGLCPFHDDHKPSMSVSPSKQIFKCFSCGAGGGVFQFVMLHDKLEFPDAVKELARRANIPLPRESNAPPAPAGLGKDELLKVMAWAADFFHSQLLSPAGTAAMEYAKKRGLSDESINRFNLGFAPDFWDALLRTAARDHIAQSQLLACGLVIQRDGNDGGSSAGKQGCYDRFRNRLMFPILDVAGLVIAFGGRALAADERAKYLNSPETVLFDKSSQLFALNQSREGISSGNQAVVVEGYMDAIMPLQAGLNNVVATLGTALTERHVRILSRYAREIVLIYDADLAGLKAAERALEIFLTQQLNVRVATIPEGKDPCDFVQARGAEAMRQLIKDAPDAMEFVWNRRLAEYNQAGGSLSDRRKVVEEFLRLVVSSSAFGAIDELRRGQLAQHIGHILNISPADLQSQMRRMARLIPRSSAPSAAAPSANQPSPSAQWIGPQGQPELLAQRHILEVLLNKPDLFEWASERLDISYFTDSNYQAIARSMWNLGIAGRLCMEDLLALEELSSQARLIADLAIEGQRRGNYEQTLTGAVEHLLYCHNRQQDAATHQAEVIKNNGLTDESLQRLTDRLSQPDARRRPRIS